MFRHIILLCCFLSVSVSAVWARGYRLSTGTQHAMGIYAEGGYARIGDGLQAGTEQTIQIANGYAVEGGVLYELQHHRFLFDVGCGFRWQQGGVALTTPLVWTEPRTDTEGADYTLKSIVLRNDVMRRGSVEIPVLFGGDWNPFYLMGGVKMGISVLGSTLMHAQMSTEASYDMYFEPFDIMDNHGLRDNVPLDQKGEPILTYDVRAHLELGTWINHPDIEAAGVRVRLGAYADYGFFTKTFGLSTQALTTDGGFDFDRYTMTPLMGTGDCLLANLSVGAKLTVLIQGQTGHNERCKICRRWNTDFRPVRHKQRCIICEQERDIYTW